MPPQPDETRSMAFSLYDATIAPFLQVLGATGGVLEKSLKHFTEKGIDPAEGRRDAACARHAAVPLPDRLGRAPFARRHGGGEKRRVHPAGQDGAGLCWPPGAGERCSQGAIRADA